MKRIKAVFVLCAMMLVLSGCSMKYEYSMEIKNDKSMVFSIMSALDDELIDGILSMESGMGSMEDIDISVEIDGEDVTITDENEDEVESEEPTTDKEERPNFTDEDRWNFLEESENSDDDGISYEEYGFVKERYEEGKFKGIRYTKKISNIDDISGDVITFKLDEFQKISDTIVFIKEGNTYRTSLEMSNQDQADNTEGYNVDISMLFTVTLPDAPIWHNADEVSEDGKTLTWNLATNESKKVEFEFSFKEGNSVFGFIDGDDIPYFEIAIGVGIVLFISIVAIGFLSAIKNKKKATNEEPTEELQDALKESTMEEPTVAPVEPTMEEPQFASVQSIMEQLPVTPTEPTMEEPQVESVETTMEEPPVVPVETTEELQDVLAQPIIDQLPAEQEEQPKIIPDQALAEMPSVADIIGLAEQNNTDNEQ